MKRLSIAVAGKLLLGTMQAGGQTYLDCDFSHGIPAGFTLVDRDGQQPSDEMCALGFAVGTPWVVATPAYENNSAACSTSWYAQAGTSDDWLITPAMTIGHDNVELSWRAKAADKRHRDGYAVYVSPTGSTDPADFLTAEPLFAVTEEESSWTHHSISLQDYLGKTVSIAFVNNSTDRSRLYVDDLLVAVRSDVRMRLTTRTGTHLTGRVPIEGTVSASNGAQAVEGYTIGIEAGGLTSTLTFTEQLTAQRETPFSIELPVSLADRDSLSYRVWVESGDSHFECTSTLTCYQRKVVGEEVTGTWCGWCVRGLVMLDSLRRTADDWFVGMAVHRGDAMECNYSDALSSYQYVSGLPAGLLNRQHVQVDPGYFASLGQAALNSEPMLVSLQLQADCDSAERKVRARTSLRFATDYDGLDMRLAYVVTENDVHHPDDYRYSQSNNYAGGGSGRMGGYESLPSTVAAKDMYYQDVVRGYIGSFYGIEGSVPSAVKAGSDYDYDFEFTLPDNIDCVGACELIVVLVSQTDGRAVNSERVKLCADNDVQSVSSVATRSNAGIWHSLVGIPLGGQQPVKPGFYIHDGKRIIIR